MTMRRRVVAAAAAVAMAVGGVATSVLHVRAGLVCGSPSAPTLSTHVAGSGATVTASYSGANGGCTATLTIGGTQVAQANSGSSIQFTVPSSPVNGPAEVTLTGFGETDRGGTGDVFVTTPTISSFSPTAPSWNQGQTIGGTNFTLGGWESGLSATYGGVLGACPASPLTPGVSATQISLPAAGDYCHATVSLTFAAFKDATKSSTFSFALANVGSFTVPPAAQQPASSVPAGQTVQVVGHAFGSGGTTSLGSVTSWSDGEVDVAVPTSATSGTLTLKRSDGATIVSQAETVAATVSGLAPSPASVGDNVSLSGTGFGTQPGSVSVAGQSASVGGWSPTQVSFTVPPGVGPGTQPVTVSTNGTQPPSGLTLSILPRITGLTPTHTQPGGIFEIDGTSFGTQQGSVSIAGHAATVTLWGDSAVVATVPTGMGAGQATVTVTVPGAAHAVSATLTVDALPPTQTPAPGASPTPGIILPPANGQPVVQPGGGVNFVKPRKPPSPVDLTLSPATDTSAPGKDVPFTVTLVAFGKPVAGAPVDLVLVIVPGSDATVTPVHGVTDAQGRLTGVIHLSRTAGDTIILARSGQYQDEIRISSGGNRTAAFATGGSGGTIAAVGDASKRLLIVAALVLCLVLFCSGFAIQMTTRRGALATAAGASAGLVVATPRRNAVRDTVDGALSLVGLAGALGACVIGAVLGGVRRGAA